MSYVKPKKKMRPQNQTIFLFLSVSLITLLTACSSDNSGKVDYFQIFVSIGYIGGVFIMLPITLFTNWNEKIIKASENISTSLNEKHSQDVRDSKAREILLTITQKLDKYQNENGEELLTITKGAQARFTKLGLDYINTRLFPSDPAIIEQVNNLTNLYNDRTKRYFSGSYWIIGSSLALGLFFIFGPSKQINAFVIIHWLGLLFYFLSSKASAYTLEKRHKALGAINIGIVSAIMGGLFMASGTKYDWVYSDGRRERAYDEEATNSLGIMLLIIVIAMILGFFAAFLGVINFLLNYSTSMLIPFRTVDHWYDKNFNTMAPKS